MVADATPPPPRAPTFGIAEVGGDRPPCAVISNGNPERGDYVTVLLLSGTVWNEYYDSAYAVEPACP